MFKKLFRQMIITQIISLMTVTLCMLIDSIMIGRFLGVDSMSAYGLASPLLLIFAAFGTLISAGVQVVCGKTIGQGDQEGTDSCFSVSVFLAVLISVIGLAVVFIFLNPVTSLLGAGRPGKENVVFGLTRDYLIGFILGAPAFLCAQIMVPYMQLSGRRTRLVVAVAAMTVTDIVFDLMNVFVFHGGTLGMGLASSLSYYVAFFIGVGYFFQKDCMFHFKRSLIRRSTIKEVFTAGIPAIVNSVSMVFMVFLLNRLLLAVEGTQAVAAYSVLSTISNICFCFGSGIGAVALMLATIFYADRDRSSIKMLIGLMVRYDILLDLAVVVIGLIIAEPLTSLFLGGNVEVKGMAVTALRFFLPCLMLASINSTFKNYYQGIERVSMTNLISFLQNFLCPILFAFLLSRFMGVNGIWLCFLCGEITTFLIFSGIAWRHHGKIAFNKEAYSMLDKDFGVPEERCLESIVESTEDAVRVSQELHDFCLEKGLDARTSMLIGLCVEEITVNIIEHGFTKDKYSHNVDVRLVLEEGHNVIRVRDNCVHFDPTSYLELHQSNDPVAHIGLRLVMGMVKEANYVNSLGLNNLTLEF